MPSEQTKIALIPAYEPADELLNLVVGLSDAHYKVVVVDDGSGPNYRRIFSAARRFAEVLMCEENKGKGRALKTGLSFIRRHYPENAVVVTLDADGQHSLLDAARVIQKAGENPDGLVLGCRRFEGEVPGRSRVGNAVTRLVYRAATGLDVSDTQTGLRAFSTESIPLLLSIPGERYEYEMNVLLESAKRGVALIEVPISTIYYDKNAGSHFSTLTDSFRIYRDIFKFAASSLAGFAVDYGLFSLMTLLTAGLGTSLSVLLSNVSARAVSACVNYEINKRFIFKSKNSGAKTAAQYFALAGLILAGNTALISFLTVTLGANPYAAKILTELTFFLLSWFVQRFVIFRGRGSAPALKSKKRPI